MMEQLFLKMMKFYSGDPKQIQHFTKVHSFARLIGLGEEIDEDTQQILEIAAIVHDIGIKPAQVVYTHLFLQRYIIRMMLQNRLCPWRRVLFLRGERPHANQA